jgi:cytochrome c5
VINRLLLAALAMMTAFAMLACASAPATPVATPTSARSDADELPGGTGKTIILASCTGCHGLREVTKFRGFYNRAQWHDIVVTMVEYGAAVEKKDVEVLADYLAEHLGRK